MFAWLLLSFLSVANIWYVDPRNFTGTSVVYIPMDGALIFAVVWLAIAFLSVCLFISGIVLRSRWRVLFLLLATGAFGSVGLVYNVVGWFLGLSAGFA